MTNQSLHLVYGSALLLLQSSYNLFSLFGIIIVGGARER